MSPVALFAPRLYECPRCTVTARIPAADPRTPMHNCAGLALMSVPLVPAGEHADVRLVEREDYVGSDDVQLDANGRPWMRAEVERPDGRTDVWVYAPTAHGGTRV